MTSEERALARHIAERERRVAEAYKTALKKASALTERIKHLMGENPIGAEPFSFDKYPQLKKDADKIIEELYESLENNLSQGINVAWDSAEKDADRMVKAYFGDKINSLSKDKVSRYFGRTEEARKAFLNRKNGDGLTLSQRVWKLTEQYKQELEMGLDIGILDGRSANEMARDLKKYLVNPDALFRRVRDERGQLQLSKNAKAYHPGQGVYRSAYKNARRLTATETNIAYRTADYERWQNMDFVLGIEVRLSNNHTLNGVPFTDICDELKGRYPKDFKFTGWHPHCRCYAVPILADLDDFLEQSQRHIDTGEDKVYTKGKVEKLPSQFTKWMNENKERIDGARDRGKLPYFLRDNVRIVDSNCRTSLEDNILKEGVLQLMKKARDVGFEVQSIAELIAEKHGATCTPINYKSEESIVRKVKLERAKKPFISPFDIKDAVRTTIIVERRKIEKVIKELSNRRQVKELGTKAIKRQTADKYIGYTGTIINLRTHNGLTAEIQINTPKMIYAKEPPEIAKAIIGEKKWQEIREEIGLEGGLGHKLYEEIRVLPKGNKERLLLEEKSAEYYSHFQD